MANMQGNGKVRLIAKKGLYKEGATANRLRELIRGGTSSEILDKSISELPNYFIEFDVTPDITESGSVSYFEAGEVRGPGSILMYMGSPSRNFSINAKLVARNQREARRVAAQIHILKSWRMPESYTGGVDAGSPSLLYLQGYGKMFKDIPVVMTDLSIEFSSEHDAIALGGETLAYSDTDGNSRRATFDSAVPIIVPVSISLKEAHSVEGDLEGLDNFDILKYRTGRLVGW